MKIYFIGAHGSGKSTLSRYVAEKYNIQMIHEAARYILAEKELSLKYLRSNLDTIDDYQNSIFIKQLEEEKKYDSFVSDRSLIDCLAYSVQHSRISSSLFNSSQLQTYIHELHDYNTFIFFVRPTKETLCEDGIRENINWDGVIAIDAIIKTFLKIFNLKYFQIENANMQERLHLIDSILSQNIKPKY